MWNRVDLKMRGKAAFQKNYWQCVGTAFIMGIAATVTSGGSAGRNVSDSQHYYSSSVDTFPTDPFSSLGFMFGALAIVLALLSSLIVIFVGNVLYVGGVKFFLLNQGQNPGVGTVIDGFRSGHYGNIVLTMFLRDLFTILWTLLFIIPGIIKSYEYRMIPYILSENPGMSYKEAFAISKRMMTGQKMETFIMDLSFFGWYLLTVLTCGLLGIFYVAPYVEASFAELYSFNKAKAFEEGYIR